MTVFLKALYGPFHRETDAWEKKIGAITIHGVAKHVDWHFFGIREDGSTGRWTLRFKLQERRYILVNYPMEDKPPLTENEGMFVPDRPMIYGESYLAILKNRLTDEDTAFITRLALKRQR